MNCQTLKKLLAQGQSSYQIAKLTNLSQTSVAYWIKKYGLQSAHYRIGSAKFTSRGARASRYTPEFWTVAQSYYNAGHTYEDCRRKFGISFCAIARAKKRGLLATRTSKEGARLYRLSETPEQKRIRIAKTVAGIKASSKPFGGYRRNAGRGKKYCVKDSFGRTAHLQSSYEFRLSAILDKLDVKWVRPKFKSYVRGLVKKKYFPDFFLVDYDLYIDTKNDYLMRLDAAKIQEVRRQCHIDLRVIGDKQITLDHVKQLLLL